MKMKIHTLFPVVLMSLVQAGCIFDKDAVPECVSGESVTINLNLSVPSSSIGSRSGNHDLYRGTDAENYIDILNGDYKLYIFDKDGGWSDRLTEVTCTATGESAGQTSYAISGKLEFSDEQEKEQLSTFNVMVLANWKSFHKNAGVTDYPSFDGYSITPGDPADIFKDGTRFNFTFPDQTASPWRPETATGQYIPMFGISDPLDLEYVIKMSKYGDGPAFNISMLRAIAKVEIIDNMPEGQTITAVSLSRYGTNGRMMPDIEKNKDWSVRGIGVKEPTLPDDFVQLADLTFDSEIRTVDGKETNVWYAYIPEMYLSKSKTGKDRPVFSVTINHNTIPNTFTFDNYYEGSVNSANPLVSVLRNHIYRYDVSGTSANLDLKLNVLKWDMVWEEHPSYFDSPQVAEGGYLKWNTKSRNEGGEEIEDSRFTDKPDALRFITHASPQEYAEATFTLKSPMYGIWKAYLRASSGETDAFYFTTGETASDGAELPLVPGRDSGTIDGNQITIRIACKYEIVSERNNEAVLVIIVQYPDRTQKEVYVVEPNGTAPNYTIVQEMTQIM